MIALDHGDVEGPAHFRVPEQCLQLGVLEPRRAGFHHLDPHLAGTGPVDIASGRQHAVEPLVDPDQCPLVVLHFQHDSQVGQPTRLHNLVELVVDQPGLQPADQVDPHPAERVKKPRGARVQQSHEVPLAEHKTVLVSGNMVPDERQKQVLQTKHGRFSGDNGLNLGGTGHDGCRAGE